MCLTLQWLGQEISLRVLSWTMLHFKLLLLQNISDAEAPNVQVLGSLPMACFSILLQKDCARVVLLL